MGFNLGNWFLRKKFDAQVRNSGRPMEHHRVVNPYHAVTIEPCNNPCAESLRRSGERFLAASAPMLPLRGCTSATCQCKYAHYNDRRSARDRRVLTHTPYAHKMSDRRTTGGGRRVTD
jgi:hypothetical protein